MWIGITTLFPEMLTALDYGIVGRAKQQGIIDLAIRNPRDDAQDKYRTVDDRPYGGGPGMVMMAQPLIDSISHLKAAAPRPAKVIGLSPQGRLLTHQALATLVKQTSLVLVCGRYEGVDERVLDTEIDEQWSIGDYVLSGGELAAMVLVDAITRLLPGALGHEQSAQQDSFVQGLLDCPHYTRPEVVAGLKVPEILRGGNHAEINRWRHQQSLGKTWLLRPDLLEKYNLTANEQALLDEFIRDYKCRGADDEN